MVATSSVDSLFILFSQKEKSLGEVKLKNLQIMFPKPSKTHMYNMHA